MPSTGVCNKLISQGPVRSLPLSEVFCSPFPSISDTERTKFDSTGTQKREYVAKYPEMELTNDPWSAKKAMNEGKIASTIGLEGGHMIGSRLSILRTY